jgi:hypothetical protein
MNISATFTSILTNVFISRVFNEIESRAVRIINDNCQDQSRELYSEQKEFLDRLKRANNGLIVTKVRNVGFTTMCRAIVNELSKKEINCLVVVPRACQISTYANDSTNKNKTVTTIENFFRNSQRGRRFDLIVVDEFDANMLTNYQFYDVQLMTKIKEVSTDDAFFIIGGSQTPAYKSLIKCLPKEIETYKMRMPFNSNRMRQALKDRGLTDAAIDELLIVD